jgi:hypothetical protein
VLSTTISYYYRYLIWRRTPITARRVATAVSRRFRIFSPSPLVLLTPLQHLAPRGAPTATISHCVVGYLLCFNEAYFGSCYQGFFLCSQLTEARGDWAGRCRLSRRSSMVMTVCLPSSQLKRVTGITHTRIDRGVSPYTL